MAHDHREGTHPNMRGILTALAMVFAGTAVMAQSGDDPHAYLNEIEGERALAFARAENERSLGVLQNDPRYQGLYDQALAIATATDRIPPAGFAGDGSLR